MYWINLIMTRLKRMKSRRMDNKISMCLLNHLEGINYLLKRGFYLSITEAQIQEIKYSNNKVEREALTIRKTILIV